MNKTHVTTILSLAALAFVAAPLAYAGAQPVPLGNQFSNPQFRQTEGSLPSQQLYGVYIAPGYPCMWSAMHDLKQGDAAYRRGDYSSSVALWQVAASKTCAVAAVKLSLMYLKGRHVPVNHALGTAWMGVAAKSRFTLPAYAQVHNILLEKLGAADQAQAHADYASLRTSLNLPVPAPETP